METTVCVKFVDSKQDLEILYEELHTIATKNNIKFKVERFDISNSLYYVKLLFDDLEMVSEFESKFNNSYDYERVNVGTKFDSLNMERPFFTISKSLYLDILNILTK